MAGQSVIVSVLADSKPFNKGIDDIGKKTAGLGKAFGAIAVATGAVVTGAAAGLAKVTSLASNLQQSIGGVESVFKEMSGQVKGFSADAADNLGLAQNSYNELATIIGTTLKNSGTPLDLLAGKTNDLIKVSADLAATFGGPVTEASNAMSSALRGEFEPLRRYGVSLNMADINAKGLAMTGKSVVTELTKQEKALATQALILEQSADAAGAFARESDTLAGKQERLRANVENVATKIGTAFLPVITLAVGVVGDLVSKLDESEGLQTFMNRVGDWGDTLADMVKNADVAGGSMLQTILDMVLAVSPLNLLLQAIMPVMPDLITAFQDFAQALVDSGLVDALTDLGFELGTSVADAVITLAPVLLELVAGFTELLPSIVPLIPKLIELVVPILELIGPLAALVAVLFSETGEESALPGIIAAIGVALDILGGIVSYVTGLWGGLFSILTIFLQFINGEFSLEQALDELKKLPGPFGAIFRAAEEVGAKLARFASEANANIRNFAGNVSSRLTEVNNMFGGLPGRILGAVGGFGSLLFSAGRNIVQGLINGVGDLAGNAVRAVMNVGARMVDGVKSFLGIKSPSRVFAQLGRFVVQGLADGLGATKPVVDAMRNMSGLLVSEFTPGALTSPLRLADGPDRYSGSTREYSVVVQAVAPNAEVGRAVVDAIDEYERMNGKR
jgi:phage-related protein